MRCDQMSLLRKSEHNCACKNNSDTGILSLQIVDIPTSLAERVSSNDVALRKETANQLQNKYISHLSEASCSKLHGASHAHVTGSVPQLTELPDLLDEHKLTMRINHMNHGHDEQAVCAEVTSSQLRELLSSGSLNIATPTEAGEFKLSSNNNLTISDMHFHPN